MGCRQAVYDAYPTFPSGHIWGLDSAVSPITGGHAEGQNWSQKRLWMVFTTAILCRQAESITGIRRVGLVWEIGGGVAGPDRHMWGRTCRQRGFRDEGGRGCPHVDSLYYYD